MLPPNRNKKGTGTLVGQAGADPDAADDLTGETPLMEAFFDP